MSKCLELSFVKEPEIPGTGRNFWNVDHFGDYREQCGRGELLALEALDLMAKDDLWSRVLLGWIALDMRHSDQREPIAEVGEE